MENMINPISNFSPNTIQPKITRENAESEFTKMFYKELLNQAFASGGNDSLLNSINKDWFVEKLAADMAEKSGAKKKEQKKVY
ncbi:MAG: hypothetical protein FD145_1273 [Candidatus Saganbacteria bacterium]|uniref:Uncharacterized protein n=1 Tax=Candidatus Saganbacteria bacterium TaxID=2575572 RepID=A0A833L071_UNCSA|nr:MAG: hypothetical protein FD145_1273 [Candidatus Saganbacteria bacterium]